MSRSSESLCEGLVCSAVSVNDSTCMVAWWCVPLNMTGVGANLYKSFCIVCLGKIYFGSTLPLSTLENRESAHVIFESSQIAVTTVLTF